MLFLLTLMVSSSEPEPIVVWVNSSEDFSKEHMLLSVLSGLRRGSLKPPGLDPVCERPPPMKPPGLVILSLTEADALDSRADPGSALTEVARDPGEL